MEFHASNTRQPVPPPESELTRVENAAALLVAPACIHCAAEKVTVARWPDGLPRAVEIRHLPGCPDAEDPAS